MEKMKLFLLKNYKILIVILVVVIFGTSLYFLAHPKDLPGVSYIRKQEKKDPDEISKDLASLKKQERQEGVANGTIDIFGLFDDYVIFGDSRTMGFSMFGFLLDNRIYASSGANIQDIDGWLEALRSLQPHNIYVAYGVNDMGLGLNNLPGGYGAVAEEHILNIQNICPNSNIYVNSILPATQEAIEKSPNWGQVDIYNEELKKVCADHGWTYIDNSNLIPFGDTSAYQLDGIHFKTDFYAKWAQNMIDATK